MVKRVKKNVSERFLWVFRVGIGFVLLSALLFLLGFSTDHWHKDNEINYGLWVKCQRGKCASLETNNLPDYHIVTQVFQILATILYALSPIIHFIMYCGKRKESRDFRTRIFDVGFSAGTVVHFVSVMVFGLKHQLEDLSWSYNMSAAGMGLGVVGVFLTTISREKALSIFDGLHVRRSKHHRGNQVGSQASGSTGSSRSDTPSSSKAFSLHTHRSVQSQNSTDTEVFSPTNQQGTPFCTATSRLPYDKNIYYKSRTPKAFNFGQIPSATDSLVLQHSLRPSTLAQEHLAPLRELPMAMSPPAPQDIAV